MTFEEAIKIGKTRQECLRAQNDGRCKCNLIPNYCIKGCEYNTSNEEYDEFETLAIKVLEQQSCENCISRQEAILQVQRYGVGCFDAEEFSPEQCERFVIQKLNELPLVAQKEKTGKWLRMSDLSEQEDDRYKCSCCGNVVHHKDKMSLYTFNSWCGRCGSNNRR